MKYIYIGLWIAAFWLMSAAENGAAEWAGIASIITGAVLLVITMAAVCKEGE